MSTRRHPYGQVDRDYGFRLATMPADDDGPIWMVNLMKYHTVARYADGNAAGVSGREADDRYAPVEILADIGADVMLFGDVVSQVAGDEPVWDRVGVVRYPTRRSFIEMQSRQDFRTKHEHKAAGMESTIVMGCTPGGDGVDGLGDGQMHGGPRTVVRAIRWVEGIDTGRLADHRAEAQALAARHGATATLHLMVEGTILGDGRRWDEVWFDRYASPEAVEAAAEAHRRSWSTPDRDRAMVADLYTVVVAPTIDRWSGDTTGRTA